MFKDIFIPNKSNVFVYVTAFFMLFMLLSGQVSPLTIVFAYVLETIIIGIFNILKMAYTANVGKLGDSNKSGFAMIVFFIFHYGMFVAIQSIFVFSFFKGMEGMDFNSGFNLIKNFSQILQLENIQYIIGFIILSNVGYFYQNFLQNKQYERYTVSELMFKPYLRIFIQQFVVIISGFFVMFFGDAIIVAVLLIVFRLITDVFIVSIKEDSEILEKLAQKAHQNQQGDLSLEKIKKQILLFTE